MEVARISRCMINRSKLLDYQSICQIKTIMFEAGNEEKALQAAQTGCTKLESWFVLNGSDDDARQWLYTDIPQHYVYVDSKWKTRQRGSDKIVSRMYTVSIKDEERFYLRMLLLHLPGATCFESL